MSSFFRPLLTLAVTTILVFACQSPVPPGNRAPVISSLTAGGTSAAIKEVKTLTVAATDPDGDKLTYAWSASAGTLASTDTASVQWTAPDAIGNATVTVVVSDTSGNSVTQSLTIAVSIPNAPVSAFLATSRPGSVLLAWDNPATANFANVVVRRNTGAAPTLVTEGSEIYTGTNETFLDEGLTPGTQYYYTVWAVNNSGQYSARASGSAIPTVPDTTAPFNVTNLVATAGDGSVTLSWVEPQDADYDRAEISFTPVQGGITQPIKVAKGIQGTTIQGLTNTVKYDFYIKTVDTSSNRSSGATTFATPASNGPVNVGDKTPPANVSALTTTAGNSKITLNWTDPADADFAYAEVTFSPTQAEINQPLIVTQGTKTITISPLRGLTAFTFTVKTVDYVGNKSPGVQASGLVLDTVAPADPANVTFTSTGEGAGILTWSNPPDFDYQDSIVTSPQTFGGATTSSFDATGRVKTVAGTSLSLSGLVGIDYTYTVVSRDFAGNMSKGTTIKFTPQDTTAPGAISGLTATADSGGGKVKLGWTNPTTVDPSNNPWPYTQFVSPDLAGLEVTYTPVVAGQTQPVLLKIDPMLPTITGAVSGLTNGTLYTFSIKAYDAKGNKTATAVTATATPSNPPPAPVTAFTSTPDLDGSKVRLAWTEPTDSDYTSTEITFTPAAGGITQPITVVKGTSTTILSGLTNGTAYTFTIKSVDEAANRSTGVSLTATPSNPAPADVTGLKATPDPLGTKVTLSWTEPTSLDFTNVSITANPALAGQPLTVAKGTTSKLLTGLTDNTAYTFTVKSVDATQTSSTGVAVTATPSNPPPAEVTGLVAAPDPLGAKVTLNWVDPVDPDLANVSITFTPTVASITQPLVVTKGLATRTISGLTNNQAYNFVVKTVDAAGNLSTGTTISATPANAPPANVTALAATTDRDGKKVTLTWTDPTDTDFAGVEVTYSPSIVGVNQPITVAKNVGTATVSGLTDGTQYRFFVKSIDAAGSRASGAEILATPSNPVPAEVSSYTVTPDYTVGAKVTLNWTEPTDSDFTQVQITVTPAVAGLTQPVTVLKGTKTKTFTGLTNGTYYTFTVKTGDVTNAAFSTGTSVVCVPWNTTGGSYAPGVKGPAGGWVVYDKGSFTNGWRYLEAASTVLGPFSNFYTNGTQTTIGTGKANTELLIVNAPTDSAPRMLYDLARDGFDDWFLPSVDELILVYTKVSSLGLSINLPGDSYQAYYLTSSASSYYPPLIHMSSGTLYQFTSGNAWAYSYQRYTIPFRQF